MGFKTKDSVHFVLCPKQGNKVEVVFPCRVCIFCPKQSQGFKPSEAQLYPNTGRVPPGVLANFITCCPLKYHVKIAFIPSILKRVQRWRGILGRIVNNVYLRDLVRLSLSPHSGDSGLLTSSTCSIGI